MLNNNFIPIIVYIGIHTNKFALVSIKLGKSLLMRKALDIIYV